MAFSVVAICFLGINATAQITIGLNGPLNFSSTKVGQQSAPQVVVVTNVGMADADVSISIVEMNRPSFEVRPQFFEIDNCGKQLLAGASCSVRVNFTPTSQGDMTASLSFGDSNPAAPMTGHAAAADNSNIFITTDAPVAGAVVSGKVRAYGWALANHEGIADVTYSIDNPRAPGWSAHAKLCESHAGPVNQFESNCQRSVTVGELRHFAVQSDASGNDRYGERRRRRRCSGQRKLRRQP